MWCGMMKETKVDDDEDSSSKNVYSEKAGKVDLISIEGGSETR
jgi:hypothetical protein